MNNRSTPGRSPRRAPLEDQFLFPENPGSRALGEPLELGAREHRAAGILRVAQKEHLRLRAQAFPESILVENPSAALQNERYLGIGPWRELHGALEVLVDRGRDERVALGRQ